TPFRPTPRHPTTAQQTSGTADCSRAAPSTAAPSAPNRTPATAEREATAQAGSTAGQVERRAFQIPATVPPAPHPRSAGSTATDDLLEPAPRSSRSRTAHRSSHPNRASDVPHISSRSADYTPTPGPIERLFPHPVKGNAGPTPSTACKPPHSIALPKVVLKCAGQGARHIVDHCLLDESRCKQ